MRSLLLSPAALPARCTRGAAPRDARRAAPSCRIEPHRRTLWRCRASAEDNIAAVPGIVGGEAPAAAAAPQQPPRRAAEELPVLAQVGGVRWYEAVTGVVYVLFMSEALRFCVESAAAPLAERLFAGALVALQFDFVTMAALQVRGASAAAAAGRDVGRFRALLALKIGAEIAGAALPALRGLGAAGATLALGGHLAFNAMNDQLVSAAGTVTPFPAPARKPLIVTDALLTGLCALGALARGTPAATCAAALFAAFAGIYVFFKFVLKRKI